MNYIVRNIVSNKTKNIYGGLLRPFVFNPAVSRPMDTARRDYMEFFIETVKEHKGDIKKVSSLTFLVKWLNYDDSYNSWEPWSGLRLTDQRLRDTLGPRTSDRSFQPSSGTQTKWTPWYDIFFKTPPSFSHPGF